MKIPSNLVISLTIPRILQQNLFVRLFIQCSFVPVVVTHLLLPLISDKTSLLTRSVYSGVLAGPFSDKQLNFGMCAIALEECDVRLAVGHTPSEG